MITQLIFFIVMEKINFRKKLLISLSFLSLITISTSLIEEVEPVTFLKKDLYYQGDKQLLYIIANCSQFNEKGTYKIKFKSSLEFNCTEFKYYPVGFYLDSFSYSYLSVNLYDFRFGEIGFENSSDSSYFYYNVNYKNNDDFLYLIFKIPINATNGINISSDIQLIEKEEYDWGSSFESGIMALIILVILCISIVSICKERILYEEEFERRHRCNIF